MNARNVRMPIVRPKMIARLWFLGLAVGIMVLFGVVLPGQVSTAEASGFPDTEWTYPAKVPANQGGNFFSGAAAVGPNGMIYAAGKLESQFHNYYYLFAFFPGDGTVSWQKQLTFVDETPQNPLSVSSPAVAPNGVIYIGAAGKLYAFKPDGTSNSRRKEIAC